MDWLNLHISVIDSPEATLCDPVRRATWVWLLRFCIGQENGGRIIGCRSWGDTTWQQMARVRLREVNAESTLWSWEGDDLVIHFYPADKEAEVQSKRELARTNGALGGRPRKTNVGYSGKPTLVISAKAEGNGMERNGTEGEYEHADATPAPPDPIPIEPPTGNDSDLWRFRIGAEPWARTLKRAGCKIGPNNWRAWQGLIERAFDGKVDTCAAAAAKVKPEDRWPDQVEAAARTEAPSAIASKYAARMARIPTVQVTP